MGKQRRNGQGRANRSINMHSSHSGEDHWKATRGGADAARGFHFQEDIGVLLAARLIIGETEATSLVPEGFEDYSCDGGLAEQIQVKSRQPGRGEFTVAEVAGFIVKICAALEERIEIGISGHPVLVLEQNVKGLGRLVSGTQLGDLPPDDALRAAVTSIARRDNVAVEICDTTEIRIISSREARANASQIVCEYYEVLPQVAEAIVRAIRQEVVRCADLNVTRDLSKRVAIDRTRLEVLALDALAIIEASELEAALTSGACEPLDLSTPLVDTGFYEGVSAQPGHIAAGLAAARPTLQGAVVSASDAGQPVLITGPSGVGKSVLLWLAVQEMPETLWFQIRRLNPDDVPSLIALVRAYRPAENARVGLVVDAIGLGSARAWDELQAGLATVSGVRLIGTVRLEDTIHIRNLADCVTVNVTMDEEVAERIYYQLEEHGSQPRMHWRTALAQSSGLTLEYTHLLTRGRRLAEVIEDQVRARRADGRFTELRILALVATAHRWGAELDLRQVQSHLGVPDRELAGALQRLLDEHLLTRHGATLGGLHQLRSTELSRAVHASPPPVIVESIQSVFRLVEDVEIGRVLTSALADYPEHEGCLLEIAHAELTARSSLSAWAFLLHGLRVTDFRNAASTWPQRLAEVGVPPALWPVTTQMALSAKSFPEGLLRDDVTRAAHLIRTDLTAASSFRDSLLRTVASDLVRNLFANVESPKSLVGGLSVCSGSTLDLTRMLEPITSEAPLVRVLRSASLSELGEILQAAWRIAPELASAFTRHVGGSDAIISRLQDEEPGLTSLCIELRGENTVLVGELVTLGSDERPAEQHLNEFVKKAMLCLPNCEITDIRSTQSDGVALQFGPYGVIEKQVRREHLLSNSEVSWNRVRLNIAATIDGFSDPVLRLLEAHALITDLSEYLELFASVWLDEKRTRARIATISQRGGELVKRAEQLRPPLQAEPKALSTLDNTPMATGNDPVFQLVQNLAGNATGRLLRSGPDYVQLAAFIADQRDVQLERVRDEPWHVAGLESPNALESLSDQLEDLRIVVTELGADAISIRALAAAAGPARGRLARAARVARELRSQALDDWLESIRTDAQAILVHDAVLLCKAPTKPSSTRFPEDIVVGVHVESLNDWFSIAEESLSLYTANPATHWSGGTRVIVPLLEGRPVPRLARRVLQSAFAGADALDSWLESFNAPLPTPITDAAEDAFKAIANISEVGALRSRRGSHPDDDVRVTNARRQYDAALSLMSTASSDTQSELVEEVTEELAQALSSAETDLIGDTNPSDTYVAQILAGARGTPSVRFQTQQLAIFLLLAAELGTQLGGDS